MVGNPCIAAKDYFSYNSHLRVCFCRNYVKKNVGKFTTTARLGNKGIKRICKKTPVTKCLFHCLLYPVISREWKKEIPY